MDDIQSRVPASELIRGRLAVAILRAHSLGHSSVSVDLPTGDDLWEMLEGPNPSCWVGRLRWENCGEDDGIYQLAYDDDNPVPDQLTNVDVIVVPLKLK